MRDRSVAAIGVLATVMVCLSLTSGPLAGQGPTAVGSPTPARTAWGDPDLQGIWDFRSVTPMERPSELAGKEVLTDEEAAGFEQETVKRNNQDRRDGGAEADNARAYNDFWMDRGTKVVGTKRTSLVVDPPDGKIPPLTEEAQKRAKARTAQRDRPAVGPEDRSLGERCILGFNVGPPMAPSAYNNNVQLFQAPGYVVIFNEMVHDARIVPLDGRPHVPQHIRLWSGDARGRWEGNTLVVETTNLRDETNFRGASRDMHLVERFTRVDAETLLYEFTIDDPKTWTRPWTAAIPMRFTEGPIFEYACHEGNHGMVGILAGARADEKAAEAAEKKRSR
jgi:hypothetical protein